jgi:dGTPase
MNWEQLLSLKRQGDKATISVEQDDTRLVFWSRLLSNHFSAAFEVYKINKLFHYPKLICAYQINAYSISSWAFFWVVWWKKIIEKYPHLKEAHGYHMKWFWGIVAAASLAHDIGNPPTFGWKAIGRVFSIGNGQKYNQLTAKEWQDLNITKFFQYLQSCPGIEGGLRFRMLPGCFYEISQREFA